MPFTGMLRRYRRAVEDGQRGLALPVVIGVGALLLLLVVTGLAMTNSTLQRSAHDKQWSEALAAAYAGVADYQARISADQSYADNCNPSSSFASLSSGVPGCASGSRWDGSNEAFATSGSQWALVGGSNDSEMFRYEVDNSQFAQTGIVRLRATGLAGDETRTVIATVRQKGFLDYLLFTDYEEQDPQATGDATTCTAYYPSRAGTCKAWAYHAGAAMNGPVGSNDAITICGGTFGGPVTVGTPSGGTVYNTAGCGGGSPSFQAGAPTAGNVLAMPRSVSGLGSAAQNLGSAACVYTGPTSIVFDHGQMRVYSPFTTTASTACGTPMAQPVSVPIPSSGLIYVQNVPQTALSGANTTLCNTATGTQYGNPLGYPLSTAGSSGSLLALQLLGLVGANLLSYSGGTSESAASLNGVPYYGCTAGDAFVQGTISGRASVVAENNIWITDDLTYSSAKTDVLGLVAQNAVEVWNPIMVQSQGNLLTGLLCGLLLPTNCTQTTVGNWFDVRGGMSNGALPNEKDRTVDAAIMSMRHSLTVQNYCSGSQMGTLTIYGSITEKYHGPQCSTADGAGASPKWNVSYNYDSRLRTMVPPYFPTPSDAAYIGTQISGATAAFNADGSPRP